VREEKKRFFEDRIPIYECLILAPSIGFGVWYIYFQSHLFIRDGITAIGVLKAICNLSWMFLPAFIIIAHHTKYRYLVGFKTTKQKISIIGFFVITLTIRKLL
jgi:hypothetical protein